MLLPPERSIWAVAQCCVVFVLNLRDRVQTVPELQELCAHAGLPKAGKKQDLVDKLAQHGGVGMDGGGGGGARAGNGGNVRGGGRAGGGAAVRRDRGGHILCPHNRQKYHCKDCGGSGICQHGRRKDQCKYCGGSGICQHGRIKDR